MPNLGIPLDKSTVFSVVLEGVLYGFSLFMFIATMWALFYARSTTNVNRTMVSTACVLLVLSTMHIIVDIVRNEYGLIEFRDTYPGGPPMWFSDVSQVTFNLKDAIYILETCVGDAVVIYRCYVVWQSYKIAIVPLFGLCCVAGAGIGVLYECITATTHATNVFFPLTGRWILAFYGSTFATNFIATALLAYRIWAVEKELADIRASPSSLMPVLLVIIDTGVLYSVTLMAVLICFSRETNGQYVIRDLVPPIISIVFYMVIIRLALQRTGRSGKERLPLNTFTSAPPPPSAEEDDTKRLEVHITKFTQNQSDFDSRYSFSKGSRRAEV